MDKPKLTDNQTDLLANLAEGDKANVYSYGGGGSKGWMKNTKGKFSLDDASFLEKQSLIKYVRETIQNCYYIIAPLGKDWLDNTWVDPNMANNDKILATSTPEPDDFQESEPKEESVLGDETTHPSYGTISISHSSGGGNLFNTSVSHNNQVRLSICKASLYRGLSEDRISGGKELIEVTMSHEQFVSFLFTPNRGVGTACTIGRFDGEMIESPPELTNKRAQFSKEFKNTLSTLSRDARSLKAEADRLLERGSLKKAERERLKNLLGRIAANSCSNLSFVKDQFEEQMDKSVSEAESEVQGAISTTIKNMGLEHLVEKLNISKNIQLDG